MLMDCLYGRSRQAHIVAALCLAALVPMLAGCPSERPAAPAHTATLQWAPEEAPRAPVGPTYVVYQVRKGDTLYSLSRRFGVPADEITRDNGISSPRDLALGALLVIRRVEGTEGTAPTEAAPNGAVAPSVAATAASNGAGASEAPLAPRRAVSQAELNRGNPGSQFWWPTAGTLARRYGDAFHGMSDPGIAISAPAGTEVYAVADGTVSSSVRGGNAPDSVWGNVVSVTHAGGMVSWYAHLANILVREGARVSKGEAIGTVGTTGKAPSPMLAFRLYHNARPVDPLAYLP
jgi:murein DD-endopeptidase MepM/ murein hydrolase activator NlpD